MRTPVTVLLSSLFLFPFANAQQFPPTVDVHQQLSQLGDGVRISAITVDATGNVYVAGLTPSPLSAGAKLGPLGSSDLFVIKLNSSADQVLYQVTIGGAADESVKAIKADSAGNLYLIGSTQSLDFPFTSALVPQNPIGGLVLKLNPAGTALSYALELGARVSPLGFDVDSTGAVYVAGQAAAQDLPNTPGVVNPSPAMGADQSVYLGFVAKVAVTGTGLDLATYFGPQQDWVEAVAVRSNTIAILGAGTLAVLDPGLAHVQSQTTVAIKPGTLQFDGTGNIYVAGMPISSSDPVCTALKPVQDPCFIVKKFAPGGSQAMFSVAVPQFSVSTLPQTAVTSSGQIYIFGVPYWPRMKTLNATQPCLANIAAPGGTAGVLGPSLDGGLIGTSGGGLPGDQALVILDANANLLHSTFFSTAISTVAVSPTNGSVYGVGLQTIWTAPRSSWRGIVRFNPGLIPQTKVSPSCVVQGATFNVVPLNPGGMMTMFGSHLGPSTGMSFGLDQNGHVGTSLGGVTMTVGGRPAVLLYVSDAQINFIVPWATPTDGSAVPVCITYDSGNSCVSVGTTAAAPGVFILDPFTPTERSAAVNQDGSINGPSAPAARGSVVAIYMTGAGAISGSQTDGGVAGSDLQYVNAAVTAIYSPSSGGCTLFSCPNFPGSVNVPVLFAGAAPGFVLGTIQVNLQIPSDMPPGNNQIFILSFKLPGIDDPVIAQARLSVK